MNYTRQYQNKINWQNEPSVSTPINETNLNKMDNALWYMDGILYNLVDLIGGGSDIRGGIISNVSSNNFRTDIHLKTFEDFSNGELLLLRSNVNGAGRSITIWYDEHSSTGFDFVDLSGSDTTVTLTNKSVLLLMLNADTNKAQVLSVLGSGGGGGASTLADLDDVNLVSLADGQVLKYNSDTGMWENEDESGGGGDTSQVRYNIVTTSTGGHDASITVNKYVNNVLKSSTLYLYSELENTITIDGLFTLNYGNAYLSYTYTLLNASTTHSAGYAYTWAYDQTVDFSDTFIVENVVHTLVGAGKAVSASNNVITTDIELFNDPKVGDRILLYCADEYASPSSIVVKVNGVDTTIPFALAGFTYKGLCLFKVQQLGVNLALTSVFIDKPLSAGTGISISNNKIYNDAPQLGNNIKAYTYATAIADGNLGAISDNDEYVILNFKAEAQPNSTNNNYTFQIWRSTSYYYGVLTDIDGYAFSYNIPAGTTLICKVKDAGSGTSADPYYVTIINTSTAYGYVRAGQSVGATIGSRATAEGTQNTASGHYSHVDGTQNTASGNSSSAHGIGTLASGDYSFSEGSRTEATGDNSHAQGESSQAIGDASFAGGEGTRAGYDNQTALGRYNANKQTSLFEIGNGSDASHRNNAFEVYSDGKISCDNGTSKFQFTQNNGADGYYDASGTFHAFGSGGGLPEDPLSTTHGGTGNAYGYIRTGVASGTTIGTGATAEGYANEASGDYSHAEGNQTTASGDCAHVEGMDCVAEGEASHAEGTGSAAEGMSSHAEGTSIASGIASHAEGGYYGGASETTASGDSSHAEGADTTASGNMSHAEGYNTTASNDAAHAEGHSTTASGANAHAEGYNTTASNSCTHAGGTTSVASGLHSFAHGQYVNAGYAQQSVFGRYNNNKSTSLFEIGNGADANNRSNAFEVDTIGNVMAGRNIYDGQGNVLAEVSSLEITQSGNPIAVKALGINAKELSVELEPIQDLHGYSKPWVGGAGKNKLPMSVTEIKAENTSGSWSDNVYTLNDVTFTLQTDDDNNITAIKVDGTASATTVFYVTAYGKFLSANTNYTINGCTGGSSVTYKEDVSISTGPISSSYDGDGDTTPFTVTNDADYRVRIVVYSGINLSNKLFYPMIRLSSESATFEPYTNICPISGREQTSVVVCGKNRLKPSAIVQGNMTNPAVSDRCSNRDDWSMPVKVGDKITVSKQSSNIRFAVAIINKKKWTLYDSGWVTNNSITITANNNGYLFLAFSYSSGNITPEEIVAAQFQAEWSSEVTAYEAYTEESATVTLGQTVYGGIVDFKTGAVSGKFACIKLNSLEWEYQPSETRFKSVSTVPDILARVYETSDVLKCSMLPTNNSPLNTKTRNGISTYSNKYMYIVASECGGDLTTFLNTYGDADIVYLKATPTEITVLPQTLALLSGYNYITGDGDMEITLIPESIFDEAKAYTDSALADKTDNSVVGTVESGTTASRAYAIGEHFIRNDKFCTCIATIASGATLTLNTNYVEGTIADNITKRVNYSATEHVIGTWINGATLYEKTVDFGNLPNQALKQVDSGLSNVTIVNLFGIGISNSTCLPIPWCHPAYTVWSISLDYSKSSNKITIETKIDHSDYYAYITLQYTKNS